MRSFNKKISNNKYTENAIVEFTRITTDMYHVPCKRCKIGAYQEMGPHDDMDGLLHCPNCRHTVDRWSQHIPKMPT